MKLDRLPKEELYNSISHLIGAFLSILGLFLLLNKNTSNNNVETISIVVYSVTLISMFLISACYHAVQRSTVKSKFRILDHANIYWLIAGTYTPVTLITLVDGNGWEIFCVVWGIAIIGTILKLFFTGRFEFLSLTLYVAMGWMIVFDFDNLILNTTDIGIILLFAGGLFYTLGIVFYAVERIPFNHFVWHLFVLAGAISHWFFIYLDVV